MSIMEKKCEDSLDSTIKTLKERKIVIIPTDTVYGFSGVVPFTDKKIREIKGRAETKPFIQLIGKPEDIYSYTDDPIPEKIFDKWPGALTVIVNNKSGGTTAFRCPGDAWLRNVITSCGCPLYSTSVNKSGSPILDTPDEIISVFNNSVDLIITDGCKKNALPSTIVKIEKGNIVVIRQGTVKI